MSRGLFTAWKLASRAAAMLCVFRGPGVFRRQTHSVHPQSGIQKLDYNGQPVTGAPVVPPAVVHNGLIYVSGQGANDNGTVEDLDITTHVRAVMNNVKKLIEGAGGDMDNVLQLTVYLATLEFYEAMNQAYRPFFPNRGPQRATVSVAGIPGKSLLEVSCIAKVVRQ